MNKQMDFLYIFPDSVKNALSNIINRQILSYKSISEIRFRINQSPFIILNDKKEIILDNII